MGVLKQITFLLCLGAIAGMLSMVGGHAPAPWAAQELSRLAGPHEITLEAAREVHPLWVDARTYEAYAQDHIPGAVFFDAAAWDSALGVLFENWDGQQAIILYCETVDCGTSAAIAERLREALGFDKIFHLKGGWYTWQQKHP